MVINIYEPVESLVIETNMIFPFNDQTLMNSKEEIESDETWFKGYEYWTYYSIPWNLNDCVMNFIKNKQFCAFFTLPDIRNF